MRTKFSEETICDCAVGWMTDGSIHMDSDVCGFVTARSIRRPFLSDVIWFVRAWARARVAAFSRPCWLEASDRSSLTCSLRVCSSLFAFLGKSTRHCAGVYCWSKSLSVLGSGPEDSSPAFRLKE